MATKREKVYQMFGGRCFYCGCELDFDRFHMDHINPKSFGGKVHGNLVPACIDCNLCKSNRTIEEFRKHIAEIRDEKFHGRLMKKYCGADNRPIKFFFEEVIEWRSTEQ